MIRRTDGGWAGRARSHRLAGAKPRLDPGGQFGCPGRRVGLNQRAGRDLDMGRKPRQLPPGTALGKQVGIGGDATSWIGTRACLAMRTNPDLNGAMFRQAGCECPRER